MQMNTKKLLVSFLAIASVLLLVGTVCAADDLADNVIVKVDGMIAGIYQGGNTVQINEVSVIAGEEVSITIYFDSLVNDTDVTFEAELEGEKIDVEGITAVMDIESGMRYSAALTLKVPFELKDDVSDELYLSIEIDGKEYKTQIDDLLLRVQRPSYYPTIKSVTTSQTISAGETFPVDLVIKNMGYNDLDDLYITVSVPALGLEQSSYFGDLVNIEFCDDDCDEDDTVSGRIFLDMPYDVNEGIYTMTVEVSNDDVTLEETTQIVVENDFTENVIVTSTDRTVEAGQTAEYSFLIVNPTNNVMVYTIVAGSNGDLSSSVSEDVVAVPAGSSRTVKVFANAETAGKYTFDVTVLSGSEIVSTISYSLDAESNGSVDSVLVLTIVLAIVFIVLLIVLIVLLTRKPVKSEEFGESYY